ncbi:hypothetical protein VWY34_16290 [Phaeobacter sp. JH20_02]|uniref:hypothetical protein n=2 Tax=unclassified Phaeobacter TaxID=2621772 RepID=UPI003A8A2661
MQMKIRALGTRAAAVCADFSHMGQAGAEDVIGFAAGAVLVALLLVATPAGSITLPVLLLIYATLSLIAWLVLRHFFKGPKGQVKHFDHDIND